MNNLTFWSLMAVLAISAIILTIWGIEELGHRHHNSIKPGK
ncbi:MAG TPA: hypothetical protein VMI12_04135 [Puia sp.]|nr:hypothetical protein [Puia sp.]